MRYNDLLKNEEEALKNEHYQHKHLSETERMRLALKSFNHLTDLERERVAKTWKDYCDKEQIPFDLKKAIWLRFLCQTNLFFLCKILEKYKDITINTHEEICNDFFVSKDPTFETFEEFANDYKQLKDRLLLVPRGGFKSSIDIADCVQWIICFPSITILILTGVYNLAKDFVGELRGHFTMSEIGRDAKDKVIYGTKVMQNGSLSVFQSLFPEHCIPLNDGSVTEFQTPACKMPDKEPTVMAAGIEQALSGWHFGILKCDDVVTNENSQTLTRMESVNRQVSIDRAMLHPYGFFDKIGTWYDEADLYGVDIAYENKLKEAGEASSMIIYLKSAWWPTEEAKKQGKIEEEMKKEDWVLWFPERLTYEFLIKEKKKDPEGFAIKYENDPKKVHQVKFPRELLVRRTIPATMLPQTGMIVQTWDTAYSIKSFADYTVGVTSLIFGGRFYIIDVVRGRFNEYDLPKIIASTGNRWKPKRITIEDSMGVRWLAREIRREMDAAGISIPIEFMSLGKGNKTKSKELKAKPVLRLLGDERFYFSNSCQSLEEVYTELEKFPKGTHDDIVSGFSILVEQYGAFADMDTRVSFTQSEYTANRRSDEIYNLVHGLGRYSKYNQNYALTDNNWADMSLAKQMSLPAAEQDYDPLKEIF